MAQQNVIPGAEVFRFGSTVLHGAMQQVQGTDEQQIAAHRVLKRDGAILEGMGWQARVFETACVFVGDNFRADLNKVRDAIRKDSEDVLVHPLHGSVKVRCSRISSSLDLPSAVNAASLAMTFIEAGLDANQLAQQAPSVAQRSQDLSDAAAALDTAVAIYGAATMAQAVALEGLAATYAAAGLAAMETASADPSLGLQALGIEASTAATITAMLADPAVALDVDRWDAISTAQLVWSAAWAMQEAIGQLRPPLVPLVVPQAIGYLPLLCSLYGTDALDREADFELWNPGIPPHLIPAGTVVYLPPATI